MEKKKVISKKNLPSRLPIWSTLTTWISLDYFNAPEWLWGACGLLYTIAWIAIPIAMYNQEHTDIFEDKK